LRTPAIPVGAKRWSLRLGTWLGGGNDVRYTRTDAFETFPFPEGVTPNIQAAEHENDRRAHRVANSSFGCARIRVRSGGEPRLNPISTRSWDGQSRKAPIYLTDRRAELSWQCDRL